MNSLIPCELKIVCLVVSIVVGSLTFSPQMRAACDSPDPGCPGANLAEGFLALGSLTTGAFNTGIGTYSLLSLTDASLNTGVGAGALFSNTVSADTAVGAGALFSNTTGANNTAVGAFALFSNIGGGGLSGQVNVAVGDHALFANTTGGENTAVGRNALQAEVDGLANTALGHSAGFNLTNGSGNVYLGANVLGDASGSESNHTYIRNIKDTTVNVGADFVTVDLTTGLLGRVSSSRRYKEDIKPIDNASEVLYRLKPVTFRYKKEIDRTRSPVFGLIAEEVVQVNPNLVARNSQGQPESVRYDQVNAMLLNEFLKEHETVQELKKEIAALTTTVKEQAAQIQKVSAQIKLNKPAPQTIANK